MKANAKHHALTMVITIQRLRCEVSRYLEAPAALDKGPIAGVEVVSKRSPCLCFTVPQQILREVVTSQLYTFLWKENNF